MRRPWARSPRQSWVYERERVVVLLGGGALLAGAAAGLEGGVLQKRRITLAQIDQHLARGVADRARQALGAAPEQGLIEHARVQIRTGGRRMTQIRNVQRKVRLGLPFPLPPH